MQSNVAVKSSPVRHPKESECLQAWTARLSDSTVSMNCGWNGTDRATQQFKEKTLS